MTVFRKSIKIFINWLLGPSLFCWLAWDLYHQVGGKSIVVSQWKLVFPVFHQSFMLMILWMVLLMFLQWGLEVLKWQLMLKPHIQLGFLNGFSGIFSGIALSMITPNRLGEFAGRVMHLPSRLRILGTTFTFIGNFGQMLVTWIVGWIAVLIDNQLLPRLLKTEGLSGFMPWIPVFMFFLVLLMTAVFFGSNKMLQRIIRIKWLVPMRTKLFALGEMPSETLWGVFILSLFRFLIFILQYWVVFRYLVNPIPAATIFLGISFMFVWLAVIPTVSLFELGLRWQFAVLLFGGFVGNSVAITAAITVVWLTNLILPATIGGFILLFWKPFPINE